MNPSDPAAPSNPAPAAQPVVDFVRTQRQNAAYLFLGLSVLCLIGSIYLAVRAFKTPAAAAAATEEKKELDPEKPPTPELPKLEGADRNKPAYMAGWIGGLLGFLITASVGIYLQVKPPLAGFEAQQREARVLLLAAGGLLGVALVLFGGAYFYLWSDSLTAWLDKGETKEMKWVVIPLLMVAAGSGLVFASSQPARAEERQNSTIRRLVYGSNFAVTALLLFVLLIVVNVVVSMKVPNKLDTTESGFYTLADSTKNFLGRLPEPVKMYLIMTDDRDRLTNDIQQFAFSAQEASEGKLKVQFVSPVSNKLELNKLQEKYPRVSRDSQGVLITAGEDEKRSAFIPFEELFDVQGRQLKGFAGEVRIMKEIRYLADNEQKPVVYFTQANGELSIAANAGPADVLATGPTANGLKTYLERNYFDVKPLNFSPKVTEVPNDATVVIVAEPQSPLVPTSVDALRRYMTARKGKLIVLTGAMPGPNDKGMAKTGLEGLLAEFNVRLGEKFIYGQPTRQLPTHDALVGVFNSRSNNPIAQQFANRPLLFQYPREVAPITGGNAQFQAAPLIFSVRGVTWLEDDRVPLNDVNRVLDDLAANEAIQVRKQATDASRVLAVAVSESAAPNPHGGPPPAAGGRLIVIGSSTLFTDSLSERMKNIPLDIIGSGIEWLRDRPLLATEAETKRYKEYLPPEPAGVSDFRLIFMPLGLGMMLIIGLGTGVWVLRRK